MKIRVILDGIRPRKADTTKEPVRNVRSMSPIEAYISGVPLHGEGRGSLASGKKSGRERNRKNEKAGDWLNMQPLPDAQKEYWLGLDPGY